MADKIDFKKQRDFYQAKRGEFRILDVPTMNYLMVDGHGDPNSSPEFADALEALYPVAYKLKLALTPLGGHLVREDVRYGKAASGVFS
jgi:hypothetical protein